MDQEMKCGAMYYTELTDYLNFFVRIAHYVEPLLAKGVPLPDLKVNSPTKTMLNAIFESLDHSELPRST